MCIISGLILLVFVRLPSISDAFTAPLTLKATYTRGGSDISTQLNAKKESTDDTDDALSDFFQGTNEFWKGLVIEPVRNYVEVNPAGSTVTETTDILTKLTAPPEIPGIPRPVWLTILGSVPTALGWYGKYSVLNFVCLNTDLS